MISPLHHKFHPPLLVYSIKLKQNGPKSPEKQLKASLVFLLSSFDLLFHYILCLSGNKQSPNTNLVIYKHAPSLFSSPLITVVHIHNLLNCSSKIISDLDDRRLFHFSLCYFMDQWFCCTANIKRCSGMAASCCQVSTLHCVIIPGLFLLIFRETKPKLQIHEGDSLTQGGKCVDTGIVTSPQRLLSSFGPLLFYFLLSNKNHHLVKILWDVFS